MAEVCKGENCKSPDKFLSSKVVEYSRKKYGNILCFDCQKAATEDPANSTKEELDSSSRPSQQQILTKEQYWANKEKRDIIKDKRIGWNGCYNSAVESFKLKDSETTDKIDFTTIAELAERIHEWIDQKVV